MKKPLTIKQVISVDPEVCHELDRFRVDGKIVNWMSKSSINEGE